MKYVVSVIFFVFGFFSEFEIAKAADSIVPQPFQRFDPLSTKTINYGVLTQWLDYLVVDIGSSDRRSSHMEIHPPLGTRIKPKVKKVTLYEGNRFFFESFENNEKAR